MGWVARVGGTLALAALAGCAGNQPTAGETGMAAPPEGRLHSANVMVLKEAQLQLQQGASVLDVMRGNLPGIRIVEQDQGCPSVAIRGPDTLPGYTEPKVYVDGTATANTCSLEDLQAIDVARVEVYPLGFTMRPGYAPNAHGLILVFTKRGSDEFGPTKAQR